MNRGMFIFVFVKSFFQTCYHDAQIHDCETKTSFLPLMWAITGVCCMEEEYLWV